MREHTCLFFAKHLSPITIFQKQADKILISKEIICVIDTSKRGFIHHASLTILGVSLTILLILQNKKTSFEIEASFIGY